MTRPTINDVQGVEPILQNMLVGYQQSDSRFVASRVFPGVPVPNDSGTYYIFTKKYWFLDAMQKRAPGTRMAQSGVGVETGTYATIQFALEYPIADEVKANSLVPMSLESAAVNWLAQQNMIRKEVAFAADFMVTGVWDTNTSVSNKWSDYQNSDPVADVLTAVRTVSANTGITPNTLVMGQIVDQRLQNHPDIIDRLKHVQAATLDNIRGALAGVFGVANYLVSTASYNSANEGATASYGACVDDDCLVTYVSPAPAIFEASAGYTFYWNGGGGEGAMFSVRDDRDHADIVQIKAQWDQKAVATDLGVFHADVTD